MNYLLNIERTFLIYHLMYTEQVILNTMSLNFTMLLKTRNYSYDNHLLNSFACSLELPFFCFY